MSSSFLSALCSAVLVLVIGCASAQAADGVDQAAAKAALLEAYPGLFTITGNTLTWTDGTAMVWDDGKERTADELIAAPDIEDMFHYVYPLAAAGPLTPATDFDPGRVRNEAFFRKLYGDSAKAVAKHLAMVRWLPKLSKSTMQVTTIGGVVGRITEISDAFQALPADLSRYGLNPGGSFFWRVIAGTTQLSVHSFGAAVDINVGFSDYWLWRKTKTGSYLPYRNRIPLEIVSLFEKYGFIWGGRWFHYDTMHFEYRPELLLYLAKL